MPVPTPAAAMAIRDSLEEEVLIALVREIGRAHV